MALAVLLLLGGWMGALADISRGHGDLNALPSGRMGLADGLVKGLAKVGGE
jgi:hypothetical protein